MVSPASAETGASAVSRVASLNVEQSEAAPAVTPSTLLNIVSCIEDLQNHVAFVMVRLEQLETREPVQHDALQHADVAQLPGTPTTPPQTQGRDVASVEAQLCAHGKEIEELKMAVHRLVVPCARARTQSPPQSPRRSPQQVPTPRQAVGDADEAAGCILSRSIESIVVTNMDETFKSPECFDDRCFVQARILSRELLNSLSSATKFVDTDADSCLEKAQTSKLPQMTNWNRPEDASLKAVLNLVDRLPQSLYGRSPAVAEEAADGCHPPKSSLRQWVVSVFV